MPSFRDEDMDLLPDIFYLWHSIRIPVLGAVVIVFLIYRVRRSIVFLQQESDHIASTKQSIPIPDPNHNLGQSEQDDAVFSITSNQSITINPPSKANTATNRDLPKRVNGGSFLRTKKAHGNSKPSEVAEPAHFDKIQPMIFYTSLTTTTAQLAQALYSTLFRSQGHSPYPELSIPITLMQSDSPPRSILPPQLQNLDEIELDDFFLAAPSENIHTKYVYIVLLPSYDPPESSPAHPFIQYLQETHNDFRIDTAPLKSLGGFSVFGVGDSSEWGDFKFCRDAVLVDKWLGKLTGGKLEGSRRIFPLGMGDCNPNSEAHGDLEKQLDTWRIYLEESIRDYARHGELGPSTNMRAAVESEDEDSDVQLEDEPEEQDTADMVDVEDIGKVINKGKIQGSAATKSVLAVDFTTKGKGSKSVTNYEKPMVPKGSPTYDALTKQGYTIVGSHSGVKICRWTKSALRGRGSCYKYSFYGIKSHLCMETTPSLSCSNKCVFCWRHGTNPVGTTWRWKVDEPEDIFRGVVEGHYKKIKMMKGVPGIRADRFAEAFRIRHCALSLVGEPIFYPHINRFLDLLHTSKISSFLVCNAQHPDQLAALKHVTQLYVSIDASNRDSLKRIDRPLHRDFWERFNRCLDILREKRFTQRTVFRLTLVKGFNMADEIKGYADLVEKGLPCFVEVKGVTYCGTSTSSKAGLTMENVPFYEEVKEFVAGLEDELRTRMLGYGIAAEHAHSCCILIASERFKIDGKWHTLIDYDKFFQLLDSGEEFGPTDYIGPPTPEWATWGNGGFNPEDERVYRKGKNSDNKSIVSVEK